MRCLLVFRVINWFDFARRVGGKPEHLPGEHEAGAAALLVAPEAWLPSLGCIRMYVCLWYV